MSDPLGYLVRWTGGNTTFFEFKPEVTPGDEFGCEAVTPLYARREWLETPQELEDGTYLPASLRAAADELERWREKARLGSKEEAWVIEEAWREAVLAEFGPEGYARVQRAAARLRDERLPTGGPRDAAPTPQTAPSPEPAAPASD